MQKRIGELRERVDEVDRELILALSERARIVQEIMDLKAEAGAPIYDPKREEEILRRVVDRNPGPIYDSSMRDIFELILHRIRDLEIQRGSFPGKMDVSASVKTNVKTTNGMIRPDTFRVIAGPCTVESYEQFVASAKAEAGRLRLRPRRRLQAPHLPYSFQG